uniref:Uncharacterized protein n=1 Tax=Octopus bimaculoides TaxID=37653 RepID=A0A0L8HA90_OCTBM
MILHLLLILWQFVTQQKQSNNDFFHLLCGDFDIFFLLLSILHLNSLPNWHHTYIYISFPNVPVFKPMSVLLSH